MFMFVMPWLSWKIGDSNKKAAWKIGDSRSSSFALGVEANLDFFRIQHGAGLRQASKREGRKGKRRDCLVSPPSPFPFPSIHLSRGLVGRPRFFVSFP